jgi:hypothetical protein
LGISLADYRQVDLRKSYNLSSVGCVVMVEHQQAHGIIGCYRSFIISDIKSRRIRCCISPHRPFSLYVVHHGKGLMCQIKRREVADIYNSGYPLECLTVIKLIVGSTTPAT